MQRGKVGHRHKKLCGRLLLFRQPKVAFFDHLDVIIRKADDGKAKRHQDASPELCVRVCATQVGPLHEMPA